MRRRGIEDVLEFFIPEEEQEPRTPPGWTDDAHEPVRPVRWGIPVGPEQILGCALAVDLADAFAHAFGEGMVLAPFAPPPLAPRMPPGVRWEQFALGDPGTSGFPSLGSRSDAPAVVLWPPNRLSELGPSTVELGLDGLLLPVEAAPWGVARALRWIDRLGTTARTLRLRVVLLGLASWREANTVFEQLAAECRAHSKVEIDLAGQIPRDRSSYRSLLAGRPLLEIDHEATSARSLEELSRRLLLSSQTAFA